MTYSNISMHVIDTHCHLEMKDYNHDRDQVIQRARDIGVMKMISVGSSLEGSKRCVELSHTYDDVFASVGVHPFDSEQMQHRGIWKSMWREQYHVLKELVFDKRVVALGECGLDYSRDTSNVVLQRAIFEDQLQLALTAQKPIILHIRDAHDDAMAMLRHVPDVRAVVHCYTGSLKSAKRYINDHNCQISFTGIVTFGDTKIGELVQVVKQIPEERIMIETDAPYISPVPHRGERNEPMRVVEVVKSIARMRGEALEQVARYTTNNAESFFHFS